MPKISAKLKRGHQIQAGYVKCSWNSWKLATADGDAKGSAWKPQDAAGRRKTPQNAYSYETPMCCRMFHIRQRVMYERLKPMNERKIRQKYKIQTAEMH